MNILIIDDNIDHRELIGHALVNMFPDTTTAKTASGSEAIQKLENGSRKFDLIMLDYNLPGEDGLEILTQIKQFENPPPIVMVTGRGDEEVAVAVMKAGAYDYVVKGNDYLTRLPVVAKRAIEAHQLKIDRQRAENGLQESEQRYRNLVENAPTGIFTIDLDGNIREVNPKLLEILGSPSAEETKKINLFNFKPLIDAGISESFKACIESGEAVDVSHLYTSKWDKTSYLRIQINPIRDAHNAISGVQANVVDITKRMQAQQELEKLNEELEERVRDRTQDLETLVSSMAGREVRMAELKKVIKKLRKQLQDADMEPVADDPLNISKIYNKNN